MIRLMACLVVFVLMTACSGIDFGGYDAGPEHLEATWMGSQITIPGQYTKEGKFYVRSNDGGRDISKLTAKVRSGVKIPVVLWVHECNGQAEGTYYFTAAAVDAGYAVISPNSMAMGRRGECRVGMAQGQFMGMRINELRYALDQLHTIPWVDMSNIVIAGFSEGAGAVITFNAKRPEVNGVIALGHACSGMMGVTLAADSDVHMLTIFGGKDRYFRGYPHWGGCHASGHAQPSAGIVYADAGHEIPGDLRAIAEIKKYLKAWRR